MYAIYKITTDEMLFWHNDLNKWFSVEYLKDSTWYQWLRVFKVKEDVEEQITELNDPNAKIVCVTPVLSWEIIG